jgi:hypothetical protein
MGNAPLAFAGKIIKQADYHGMQSIIYDGFTIISQQIAQRCN